MNNLIHQTVKKSLSVIAVALLLTFTGCGKLIYEDLSDCPMGVYISFYEMTAAKDTMTVFPGNPVQQNITVLVFDKNGVLVATQTQNLAISNSVTDRSKIFIPITQQGEYSFVAWSGTPGGFDMGSLTVGTSKKDDIITALKRAQETVDGSQTVQLYYGMFKTHDPVMGNKYTQSPQFGSNSVIFRDPAKFGSQYIDILVGMNEQTRRVHINGINFGYLLNAVDNLKIVIKGNTADYTQTGVFPANAPQMTYTSVLTPDGKGNLKIDFNTLGKILEDDTSVLEISFTDKSGKQVVKTYKLIDLIKADSKYSDIADYDYVYDYYLDITIKFYIAATGEVMNWTLITRDIVLS